MPSVLIYLVFYSDVSTSRTLAATSFVQDPMTIETCIYHCQNASYIYAGVEFGRESSFIVYVLLIDRLNVLNAGVSFWNVKIRIKSSESPASFFSSRNVVRFSVSFLNPLLRKSSSIKKTLSKQTVIQRYKFPVNLSI